MSKLQYYCASSLDGYIAESDDSLTWLTGQRDGRAALRDRALTARLRYAVAKRLTVCDARRPGRCCAKMR